MPTETAKPKLRARRAVPPPTEEQVERDAARYEALAREHGADLSEDGFNEALKKMGRSAPDASKTSSLNDDRR